MTVKRKISLKIFVKAVFLLLLAVAFCGIFFYYQTILQKSIYGIFAIPVLAILYILIAYKSKFFTMLFDKDWEGEVLSLDVKIAAEPITFGVAVGRTPPKMIPYTIIIVRTDNGKTVKLTIQSSKIALCNFRVGGRIKHYKGTKYPIILSEKTLPTRFCPICGRSLEASICPDCNINF